MNNRRSVLNELIASLEPIYGSREARSISQMVVERFLGWSARDFIVDGHAVAEVEPQQWERFEQAVRELMQCRPVQYVMGEADFYGLRLTVREGVLIPRPETEELVDWIAAEHKQAKILDVGTGSGAIAIALALEGNSVSAIDLSIDALAVARENALKCGVEVDFQTVDILNPPREWIDKCRYDVIVSNPPYIPENEITGMSKNVTDHEPHMALFVPDNDPLVFYKAIAIHAQEMLVSGGYIYFEIHDTMGEGLSLMLKELGYVDIELRRDINNKPRKIRCRKSF